MFTEITDSRCTFNSYDPLSATVDSRLNSELNGARWNSGARRRARSTQRCVLVERERERGAHGKKLGATLLLFLEHYSAAAAVTGKEDRDDDDDDGL